MKTLGVLILSGVSFAATVAKEPPKIDSALQIEILATQLELANAQEAARRAQDEVKRTAEVAQKSADKAMAICNAGGEKLTITIKDRQVVCVPLPSSQPTPPAK